MTSHDLPVPHTWLEIYFFSQLLQSLMAMLDQSVPSPSKKWLFPCDMLFLFSLYYVNFLFQIFEQLNIHPNLNSFVIVIFSLSLYRLQTLMVSIWGLTPHSEWNWCILHARVSPSLKVIDICFFLSHESMVWWTYERWIPPKDVYYCFPSL